MATLGKDIKGASNRGGGGGAGKAARLGVQKAKLSAAETADLLRRETDARRQILMVRRLDLGSAWPQQQRQQLRNVGCWFFLGVTFPTVCELPPSTTHANSSQERFEAESALARVHASQVEAGWRAVMRIATAAGMKEEAEALAEQHER